VIKVIGAKPQVIFLGTYYQFVRSVKAIHDFGYKGNLFNIEANGKTSLPTTRFDLEKENITRVSALP